MESAAIEAVIPYDLRCLFPYPCFNELQCQVLDAALRTDNNIVVAAPTGSGKTAVLELALARVLIARSQSPTNRAFRCVYIAPSKALCQQRWTDWKMKLRSLALQVLEVTGDVDWKDILTSIASASIIITTPEKWDALTRMWRVSAFALGVVDLLLLDEIHHIGEQRGACLETVVMRLKMINDISKQENPAFSSHMMRIVALSATLPNVSDVGKWLQCDSKCTFYFDGRFRPVPLKVLCFGYESRGNQYMFEKSLDRHLLSIIATYSDRRPTLVFCASKKGAQNSALALLQQTRNFSFVTADSGGFVAHCCEQVQDRMLAELLPKGLAYHHAGLPPDDRMIVEQLFTVGKIAVLCSTSTLAHGMNLPAHLVIVKGTHAWRGSSKGYEPLKKSDIIQMLGRAGRPGFDEDGVAVIMTSLPEQPQYSSISLHADLVNSNLENALHEALVSEISQNVITSLATAIDWIRSSFYYVRLLSSTSPRFSDVQSADNFVASLCERYLKALVDAKLIEMSEDKSRIQPVPETHIMSRALVRFSTMKILLGLNGLTRLNQLISAISRCEELSKPVRRSDKKTLNDLMPSLRFPIRERVQEPHHKAYVLLQAVVGGSEIKDFALRIEQADIVDNASRILKGLHELCVHYKWGGLLEATILLERALRTRLWEGHTSCPFLQCAGLSAATLKKLQDSGIHYATDIFGLTANQVQQRVGCNAEEAKRLLQFSASLMRSKLVASLNMVRDGALRISVALADPTCGIISLQSLSFQLLCYDAVTGELVCFRRLAAGCKEMEIDASLSPRIRDISHLRCRILGSLMGADFCTGADQVALDIKAPSTSALPKSRAAKKTNPVHVVPVAAASLGAKPAPSAVPIEVSKGPVVVNEGGSSTSSCSEQAARSSTAAESNVGVKRSYGDVRLPKLRTLPSLPKSLPGSPSRDSVRSVGSKNDEVFFVGETVAKPRPKLLSPALPVDDRSVAPYNNARDDSLRTSPFFQSTRTATPKDIAGAVSVQSDELAPPSKVPRSIMVPPTPSRAAALFSTAFG